MDKTVDQHLADIKAYMPETYKSIKAKAAEIGNTAYALVRRSLPHDGKPGEANCFYAFERGHVKGTPVVLADVDKEVAWLMVRFGSTHVCTWGPGTVVPVATEKAEA